MWKFKRTREREYLTGIPARDLEDAEVEALSQEDRERLEASGLYRHVEPESVATSSPRDAENVGETPAFRRTTTTRGGER